MKKVLSIFICLFLITSCSNEKNNLELDQNNLFKTSTNFNLNNVSIEYLDEGNPELLHLEIRYLDENNGNEHVLNLKSDIEGNSSFVTEGLGVDFKIEPCAFRFSDISDIVKYEAAEVVRTETEINKLKEINDIFNESLSIVMEEIINNNQEKEGLLYNLFIHKSIITTSIRSILDQDDCNCLPHPASITGKSYFACQEDLFYNKEILMNELNNYINSNVQDFEKEEAEELLNYVGNLEQQEIRYDDYYSFFIPKEFYMNYLKDIENTDNNSNDELSARGGCIYGQGSAHGCCGNYSGCCYYWNVGCYVHDKMCSNCTPRWFCFSGCVEDKLEVKLPDCI